MVTIYIQNKPLFLTDTLTEKIDEYLHRRETIFIDELNSSAVKTMLHELDQRRFYQGVFLHPDVDELLDAFKAELTVIPAAGGLVHTKQNELLLIHRLGRWDLPKGKLDEGEDLETCALREIEEETGASALQIQQPLGVTYHTYHQDGNHCLKESHWYLVRASKKSTLSPQKEEGVEQCLWVPMNDIQPYIDGAFPSVADVLREGVAILQETPK